MSTTYENPSLSRNAVSRAWSVRGDDGLLKSYKEDEWNMTLTFTRKPLKVGDTAITAHGLTGKILAVHEESGLAWVSGAEGAPVTLRHQDLRRCDDV